MSVSSKIKLLLADDNKEFCDVISGYLNKQEDMEVVGTSHDGVDTYNKIKDLKPQVAIIDGIMPRLDGLGVLEKLEKQHVDPKPMCIILSAMSQDKIIQRAMDLGAEYYMVKPFDMSLWQIESDSLFTSRYRGKFLKTRFCEVRKRQPSLPNMTLKQRLQIFFMK